MVTALEQGGNGPTTSSTKGGTVEVEFLVQDHEGSTSSSSDNQRLDSSSIQRNSLLSEFSNNTRRCAHGQEMALLSPPALCPS